MLKREGLIWPVTLLAVILLFFIVGFALTIVGWKMTGKLIGLGIMLVGIIFLLAALFVYNAPYRK